MGELKVISIDPDEDIIALLNDALAQALAGNLTGVSIACLTVNREVYHEWAGQDIVSLLGASSMMVADMNEEARKL